MYQNTRKTAVLEDLFPRPRVDALLEAGIRYPAMVLAAGMGFGKTQAMASFLARSGYRGVWHQLTPLDNLPIRFWESFCHTISLHRADMGQALVDLGFPDTLYKFQRFLELFTKDLYQDSLEVVFVLDDFHVLTNDAVRQFFIYLVSAQLENICFVFLTRDLLSFSFDPDVFILTAEDLRFTREEAMGYLSTLPKQGVDLETLYQYTGGWPLALGLVKLQLARSDTPNGSWKGDSKQAVFAIIRQDIFLGYTEAEQRFFVTLSIFNSFPKGLVDRLSHEMGVDAKRLMNNNPFVLYDEMAENYYLHQIFLDFLLEKRGMLPPEMQQSALLYAADWCRENGYGFDAINYYLKLSQFESVWEILSGFDGVRHSKTEAAQFIRYLEAFPQDFMDHTPMCRIVYAMLLLNNVEMEKATAQINLVHRQLGDNPQDEASRRLKGEAHVAAGLISLGLENYDFVEHFQKADALLPNGSSRYNEKLRLVEFSHALNLSTSEKGEVARSIQMDFLGMPYVSRVLHGAGYGREYLASGEAHILMGDLKAAQKDIYTAMYRAEEKQQYDIVYNAMFWILRMGMLTGDDSIIADMVRRLEDARENGPAPGDGVIDIALGWFYSEYGMVDQVAGWVLYDQEGNTPPISVDRDSILRVRCLIIQGKHYEALALLERLEDISTRRNSLITLINVYVYRAVLHYQLDDLDKAIQAVRLGYDIAKGDELYMPFIIYGHMTRSLFENLIKREDTGLPQAFLQSMRQKTATYAKRHGYLERRFLDANKGDSFGLTPREIELLKNLSQGLNREEMGQSMYVSPHTIKSMLKTVYNKLGAINSADAVRIAIHAKII
ncbi:LuxR C-terminal-related transcriptional regulator [Eubacteriales bacterium OttesenSCG-928-M02]|nr:LuxR C-terminal-related transcriptional regulator [Eubacteriales bacterium OttesenSCG-928-M02]